MHSCRLCISRGVVGDSLPCIVDLRGFYEMIEIQRAYRTSIPCSFCGESTAEVVSVDEPISDETAIREAEKLGWNIFAESGVAICCECAGSGGE